MEFREVRLDPVVHVTEPDTDGWLSLLICFPAASLAGVCCQCMAPPSLHNTTRALKEDFSRLSLVASFSDLFALLLSRD